MTARGGEHADADRWIVLSAVQVWLAPVRISAASPGARTSRAMPRSSGGPVPACDVGEDGLPGVHAVGHLLDWERADDGGFSPLGRSRRHGLARPRPVAEAGATVAARPVDRIAAQVRGRRLELCGQRDELAAALLGVADPGRDQLVQPCLHRSAVIGRPQLGEVGDLLEGAAELLRPVDEAEPRQRRVVVEPVAGVSAPGRFEKPSTRLQGQGRSARRTTVSSGNRGPVCRERCGQGWMFWLTRNRLSGSYLRLTSTRRA